nr:MAG TPA: hypothetical protein [Caudoviricetes sp.]
MHYFCTIYTLFFLINISYNSIVVINSSCDGRTVLILTFFNLKFYIIF